MSNAILNSKLIKDIKGSFFIPDYQRGYRWDKEAVRLLDDIKDAIDRGEKTYCLQPIVVKRKEDGSFELIDGQQRLTTIFLIYKVLSLNLSAAKAGFELAYESREKSKEYIETISEKSSEEYIDFYYMRRAYCKIKEWFEKDGEVLQMTIDFHTAFTKIVRVIWYEVDESEDSNKLFQRLNIGKIPLTSAELVKAIFLSQTDSNRLSLERQEEISLQWDNMEKELHNDSLWFFLTNSFKSEYQTRIDLVLDLMAKKKLEEKDDYYTFFYFDDLRRSKELKDIWTDIQKTFLTLKDWFKNHDLYHKIGYLIASNSLSLQGIYDLSVGKKKDEFIKCLDEEITKSIAIDSNYGELSYEKRKDYLAIQRLLILFNVESVRQKDEKSQWFPFDKYKGDGSFKWSLEHIHAQNSEGLKTEEQWRKWLELHIGSLEGLENTVELVNEIKDLLESGRKIQREVFEPLQQRVVERLSSEGDVEYKHSIANLALLNTRDNAALNNSTFDVKRNEIVKMDMDGKFIPYCTKMVFLKYYTESKDNNVHFWGQKDREAYIYNINKVLSSYLTEEIEIQKDGD